MAALHVRDRPLAASRLLAELPTAGLRFQERVAVSRVQLADIVYTIQAPLWPSVPLLIRLMTNRRE